MSKIRTECETALKGRSLVERVLDPEIAEFERWFRDPRRGNGPLTNYEREILRSYLWWKLVEDRCDTAPSGAVDGST
jgi:hypothetical protein